MDYVNNLIKLSSAMFMSFLLISISAQAGEKVEFGKADINFKTGEDAAKMIGQDVVNNQGEELGTIEHIMVGEGDSGVTYAILSVGGFLGIGDKQVAVPVKDLKKNDEGSLRLNVSKEDIDHAPPYDSDRAIEHRTPQYGPSGQ